MNDEEMMQIIQGMWADYERGPLTQDMINNPAIMHDVLTYDGGGDMNIIVYLMEHNTPKHTHAAMWLISLLGNNKDYIKDVLVSHSMENELTVLAYVAKHMQHDFNRLMNLFDPIEKVELVNVKEAGEHHSVLHAILEAGWGNVARLFIAAGADVNFVTHVQAGSVGFWACGSGNVLYLAAQKCPYIIPEIIAAGFHIWYDLVDGKYASQIISENTIPRIARAIVNEDIINHPIKMEFLTVLKNYLTALVAYHPIPQENNEVVDVGGENGGYNNMDVN